MTRAPTTLAVGSRPARFTGHARYLDGDRPVPRPVALAFDDEARALVLQSGGEALSRWPYDDLRAVRDQAGGDQLVLRLRDDPTRRLVVTDPETIRVIEARADRLHRSPPVDNLGRILALAVAAIASVALIIGVLIPIMANQLANFLPPEGEKALGDATLLQIRRALDETGFEVPVCERPEGLAALGKIERRLTDGADLPVELTVTVLDHPMVNAFALPGGHVILFRGLIEEAETPEEVAAVFAHEIGHVVSRDPTRIALRSAGSIGVLGLLFGDFAGGAIVLFLAEQMIRADYTRAAEAEADAFAHRMLLDAGLPPSAIATFFERLMAGEGEIPAVVQHFLSHPEMGDRIAAARAAEPEGALFPALLTPKEWRALRRICR